MVIVLVEGDHLDAGIAEEDMERLLPGSQMILVQNVSEFLFRKEELRRADVVVTERYLAFIHLGASQEDFDKRFADATKRFTEIFIEKWNARDAGWILARWMRKNGFNMPIIFHMHSSEESIPEDLRADEKVSYCHKEFDPANLPRAVKDAVGKSRT